jgi:Phage integrase, N-terminal SAM-like domain
MTDQLPAIVQPGALATPTDTYRVPALIVAAGDQAGWRYVEFFAANVRNPHTRRAYARACGRFFAWCEDRGLALTIIRPFDVAAWIDQLQEKHRAPGVKQQLAAVRMLFDWLITGQVVPMNPAAAVRGPKHVVKAGKTPVLDAAEWRKLVDSIPTETVRDLRDHALIATRLRLVTDARHSQPSSNVANWEVVNEIAPVLVIGQIKWPRSKRFVSRHRPMPSCQRSLIRPPLLPRKANTAPSKGF